MRRRWWFRPVGVLLALWFSVSISELPGFHTCPMHGVGAQGMSMPMGPGAMAGTSAATGTHADAAHPDGAPSGDDHDHGGGCTCPGLCCAACGTAMLIAVPLRLSVPLPVAGAVAVRDAGFVPRVRRSHLLPFANGPPAGLAT